MSDVTRILAQIESGDPSAADQLLPLVCDELRKLAAEDADAAGFAQLHLFAGLSVEQAGEAMGQSRASAYRNWKYARAWLWAALEK